MYMYMYTYIYVYKTAPNLENRAPNVNKSWQDAAKEHVPQQHPSSTLGRPGGHLQGQNAC